MTLTEWVFPVDRSDDPELAYAMAHRTRRARQRDTTAPDGPMRYVIGDDGALIIMEEYLPLLRAFLEALDAAPQGTRFVDCARCGCRAVWVQAGLRGVDNTGAVCDDHDCNHGNWNTRHDATCRFCGEELLTELNPGGVASWVDVVNEMPNCSQNPGHPSFHKPES